MKLHEKLPQFLNGEFFVLEPNVCSARNVPVKIGNGSSNSMLFSLTEVFSSEALRNAFRQNSNDDSGKHFNNEQDVQIAINDKKLKTDKATFAVAKPSLIEQYCMYAELYLEAVNNIPYECYEDHSYFFAKLDDYLNKKNADLVMRISKSKNIPKVKISTNFNLKLIKLINQMRNHLFIKTNVKLSQNKLLEMFNQYKTLKFDADSTTDIFLSYKTESIVHLKLKCDIVFGINLYYLLQKEGLLDYFRDALFSSEKHVSSEAESSKANISTSLKSNTLPPLRKKGLRNMIKKAFFWMDSDALPSTKNNNAKTSDSNLFELMAHNESLKFIKPLFSIVSIEKNINCLSYSINMNEAFINLSYKRCKGNKICLFNQSDDSTQEPLSFLNLFNEGNGIFRKTVKLEVVATEERTEDLDAMILAVLQLFPEIKTLSVSNTSISKYNEVVTDHYTYYDMLLENLVSKNEQALKHLTGFEMHGFNRLSLKSLLNVKQYEFKKLGLRGIFSCLDELYLWIIFREENIDTLKKLYEIFKVTSDLETKNETELKKYNNLRNSTTHLIGTEEIVRASKKYCLIENLEKASAYLYGCNNNYELYHEELLILEQFNIFKEGITNEVQASHALKVLEVYPEEQFMYVVAFNLREQREGKSRRYFFSEANQNNTCIYNVSELMVTNSLTYKRCPKVMQDIISMVSYSENIRISVTNWDCVNRSAFAVCFEFLEDNNKSLVLCYPVEKFFFSIPFYNETCVDNYLLQSIGYYYDEWFNNFERQKLTILLYSEEYFVTSSDEFIKTSFEYLEKRNITNRPPWYLKLLRKKIRFEVEAQNPEEESLVA